MASLPGLIYRLSAKSVLGKADNAIIALGDVPDVSGMGNSPVGITGTIRYAATEDNGSPAIRFNAGGVTGFLTLPNFLVGLAAGEVLVRTKIAACPPTMGTSGSWHLGNTGWSSHYPWTDTVIYESFGTNDRKNLGASACVALTAWHNYNISTAPGSYTARRNGTQLFFSNVNTVAWPAQPLVGRSSDPTHFFSGWISDLMIFDHVLTPTERAAAIAELGNFIFPPTNPGQFVQPLGGVTYKPVVPIDHAPATHVQEAIEYRYEYREESGAWDLLRDWGVALLTEWTPAVYGDYQIRVKARTAVSLIESAWIESGVFSFTSLSYFAANLRTLHYKTANDHPFGRPHRATRWQAQKAGGNWGGQDLMLDTDWDFVNLTSFLTEPIFIVGEEYEVRAWHIDTFGYMTASDPAPLSVDMPGFEQGGQNRRVFPPQEPPELIELRLGAKDTKQDIEVAFQEVQEKINEVIREFKDSND